jgi:phosphoglycolate phosphatase-like HAD superfamily hydrolase
VTSLTARLLLLWDIDGTLMQRASEAHAAALRRALSEVHGDALALDGVRVEAAGRTDGSIARELLSVAGVAAEAIDREVEAVARATAAAYHELCPADLSGFVAPGIPELLAEVAADPRLRSSLVTGNFEPVARLKLERAGIGSFFEPGQGGFGTDAEERAELPPIARGRAGADPGAAWPRERTVVIGDTPRDIACARADGLRVVAVTTGPFAAADLGEADHVVSGAAELRPLLDALAAG